MQVPVSFPGKDEVHGFLYEKFCEGCGNCCRLFPLFGEWEAKAISKHTGLKVDDFADVRIPATEDKGAVLTTKRRDDGYCIFFGDDRECTIYPARPSMCADATCYPLRQDLQSIIRGGLLTVDEAERLRENVKPNILIDVATIMHNNAKRLGLKEEHRMHGRSVGDLLTAVYRGEADPSLAREYRSVLLAPYRGMDP